jgi:hypothetical protein
MMDDPFIVEKISRSEIVTALSQNLVSDLATRLFDTERRLIYWRAYAVGCTLLAVFLAGHAVYWW